MADISRSRTIDARPQAIWDVLADFGSLSSWAADADHSCIMNRGPEVDAVGTTRRVQIGRNVLVERITESVPRTALAYDVEGLPSRLGRVVNRWTLRPAGNGTVVTLTSRVEIGAHPAGRAAEWMACRGMAKRSAAMLAGLARRLEDTHG